MTHRPPDQAAEHAALWAQWYGFDDSDDLKEWSNQHELQRQFKHDAVKYPDE